MAKPTKPPARKARPTPRPAASLPVAAPAAAPMPAVFPADATPMGGGSYVLTPRKPLQEAGTLVAMKVLGYKSRASIYTSVLLHPLAKKYLKYRLTPGGGKIIFNVASLFAFREACLKHPISAKGRSK